MVRVVREPVAKMKSVTWKDDNTRSHAQMHENLETPPSQLVPQVTDYSRRWLIAIDIGTTQLYIRYKRPDSNDEISVDGYNAYEFYDGDGAIIPTDLYYPLEGGRPKWGRQIKMERYLGRFDSRRWVRFWKPAIHKTDDEGSYHDDLRAQALAIFGAPNVSRFAKDFFSLLFEFLFHPETGYFKRTESNFRIEQASVVLSKPSGWPHSEYLIFKDAGEDWGFQGQMSFVSETDGLALSWLRRDAKTWEGLKVGFTMLVVDWGGGTVDIDVLEISQFDKNELDKIQVRPSGILALSLRHGSETCLHHFAEHMRSRFCSAGYPSEKIRQMVDEAVFQFSQMKSNFQLGEQKAPWFLNMREVSGGSVPLEQSEIKQQFDPSVEATTDAIDKIVDSLKKSQSKLPEVIIIGGGASAFPYFFDSLVERYDRGGSSQRIPVKRVQAFKKGVAEGAIHLRRNMTGFMQYSLSRESYAIPCRIEDVAGVDRERMLSLYPGLKSKKNKKDGKFYFPIPVLQWFIKEGDIIGPNVVIEPDFDSGTYDKRHAEIRRKGDLCFEEALVIYRGHPGPHNWTPYDSQTDRQESYRIEWLIVDLRDDVDPQKLPRMNSKKGELNRKIKRLDYDYSVEFEGETPNYFVQFKKPGENTTTKRRVHTTRIDLARLEGHQSLFREPLASSNDSKIVSADDDSSSSLMDGDETILSSDTSSIDASLQLKREQELRAAVTNLKESFYDAENTSKNVAPLQMLDVNIPTIPVPLQEMDSEFSSMAKDAAAVVPHEFDRNPMSTEEEFQNSATVGSANSRSEPFSGIPPQFQSRPLLQNETQPSQATSKAPSQGRVTRVTRRAVSTVLAPVNRNVQRQNLVQSNVKDEVNGVSHVKGKSKGSLLPIPSQRPKGTAGSGSRS